MKAKQEAELQAQAQKEAANPPLLQDPTAVTEESRKQKRDYIVAQVQKRLQLMKIQPHLGSASTPSTAFDVTRSPSEATALSTAPSTPAAPDFVSAEVQPAKRPRIQKACVLFDVGARCFEFG